MGNRAVVTFANMADVEEYIVPSEDGRGGEQEDHDVEGMVNELVAKQRGIK